MDKESLNFWNRPNASKHSRNTEAKEPGKKRKKKSFSDELHEFQGLLEKAGMKTSKDSEGSWLGLAIDYIKNLQEKGKQMEV